MNQLTEAEVVIRAVDVDGREYLIYAQLDMRDLDSGIQYQLEPIYEYSDIYTAPVVKHQNISIEINGRGKPFNEDGHFITVWEDHDPDR